MQPEPLGVPQTVSATSSNETSSWSFRDPAGRLVATDGRILRLIRPEFRQEMEAVLSSRALQQFIQQGRVVGTVALDPASAHLPAAVLEQRAPGALVLEHERLWFPTFPYEWAPEMLYAAGELTLDLAEGLIADDLGLKDGTPFNVLFRGPLPVFVDVGSMERRDPQNPVWLPYAQFVRTFLLPLLVAGRGRASLQEIFLVNREGLEPEQVYRSFGWWNRVKPPFLSLVSMPTWLRSSRQTDSGNASIYKPKRVQNPEMARFVLRGVLRRLRKTLHKVQPGNRKSAWSGYTDMSHYSDSEMDRKLDFVTAAAQAVGAKKVLDIGCNTGRFSIACASAGAEVVAIDYDPVVIGTLWRQASAQHLQILPLAVNLAQPTPSTGWRNQECPSFLARARGKFDLVLMLAVIHHLLVTDRVPLMDILQLASELTSDAIVIEFVPATDPMFRLLVRGREELHRDFTQPNFEQACARFFRTLRKEQLAPDGRCLYLLKR